jgi:hypothetical protein
MLQTITLRIAPEVKRVIQLAFPSYKKHNAFLSAFPDNGKNINSYWDGGSRDEYAIVNLATMQRQPMPTSTHPFFDIANRGLVNSEDKHLAVDHVGNVTLKFLPDSFALVQSGTFCGKPATAHVYLNSANMTKFLRTSKTENADTLYTG